MRRTAARYAAPVALFLVGSLAAEEPPLLVEITADVGVDFVHLNGMSGELYFPEMKGQGGALFDADSDGDLDLFAVQGGLLGPGVERSDLVVAWDGEWPPTHRLYRNRLREDGELRFVDATRESGLAVEGYGMGAATGDVDGDGDVDLFVTAWGKDRLFLQEGDGTYTDVTAAWGIGSEDDWSTSASFVDLDGDGRLDLYVARYVAFDLERNPRCYATSSRRDYCGPSAFPGVADRLLLNRGGRFEDVSVRAGLAAAPDPGLGVIAGDLDGDGRADVAVANDGRANRLWSWRDGRLVDGALLAGLAVNREGVPEASMGLALGDFDLDGDEDLIATHLTGETDTLWENRGEGLWEDRTRELGPALGAGSLPTTGFGVAWADLDRDGWPDLVIAAGAVRLQEDRLEAGDPYPLGQPNRLLLSRDGRRFEDASARTDPSFRALEVSRGLATGDVDDDGAVDVVVFNNNGPLRLYRGTPPPGRWLGLDVRDARGAPALGARVEVRTDRGPLVRTVRSDGSYCSASDPRLLFGLGERRVEKVLVRWPDGTERELAAPAEGATTLVEPLGGAASGSDRTQRGGQSE